MNKLTIGIISVLGILVVGLGIGFYFEHSGRVKAEQQVETLIISNNSLQDYIKQKSQAYEALNKKYAELKASKPNDLCGDSLVSDEIIEWLQGGK